MTRTDAIKDMAAKLEALAPGMYQITPDRYGGFSPGGDTIDILDGGVKVGEILVDHIDFAGYDFFPDLEECRGFGTNDPESLHEVIMEALSARRKAAQEREEAETLADKVRLFLYENKLATSASWKVEPFTLTFHPLENITITATPVLRDGELWWEGVAIEKIKRATGTLRKGEYTSPFIQSTSIVTTYDNPLSSAIFAELLKGD